MIKNWQLFTEELVGENPIKDLQSYISGMSHTISDKLFFIDKIDFDLIVDFGCADGTFLQNLSKINPKIKLIGYDLDEDMLQKARKKVPTGKFTSDWEEVKRLMWYSKSPLLNLSSVIHEVYSYSKEVKSFWSEKVFYGGFKYITIRDMIPSLEINKEEFPKFKDDVKNVRKNSNKNILNSFEDRWGSITSYRNLIHYLMKYRFIDNWERELNENYLPISLETLKGRIPSNYKIVFEENFLLEFLKKQVKSDFNVELTHPTHLKMILRRND